MKPTTTAMKPIRCGGIECQLKGLKTGLLIKRALKNRVDAGMQSDRRAQVCDGKSNQSVAGGRSIEGGLVRRKVIRG
jgi:hypothetical protein